MFGFGINSLRPDLIRLGLDLLRLGLATFRDPPQHGLDHQRTNLTKTALLKVFYKFKLNFFSQLFKDVGTMRTSH